MKFQTINIANFMRFGEETAINLNNQGLVGLFGDNGSGKSSIFEAIVWCLWGSTIRGLKIDDVVNREIGKDCAVTLVVEDNGTRYDITRVRKYKGLKKENDLLLGIYRDDGVVDVSAGTMSGTQDLVDTLVGMDYHTFVHSVFLTGNQSFCELDDAKKKEILENILQIEHISRARDRVSKKLSKVEKEYSVKEARIKYLEEYRAKLENKILILQNNYETFGETQRTKIIELRYRRAQYQIEEECIWSKIGDYGVISEEIAELEKQYKELEDQLREKNSAVMRIEQMRKDHLSQINKQRWELESNITILQNNIKNISQMVATECPTCHQFVAPNNADASIEIWQNGIFEGKNGISKLDVLASEVEKLAEESLAEHRDDFTGKMSEIAGKIRRLEDQKIKIQTEWKNLVLIQNTLEDIRREIDSQREETNPYKELLDSIKEDLMECKAELSRKKLGLKSLDIEIRHLKFWKKGFGNQGLKSYLMDSVIPFLNKRVKYYTDVMCGGKAKITFATTTTLKSGKTRDKLTVNVVNDDGAEIYAGLSAGEKRRVNVAVGLTLADLAATRGSKSTNIRVLDEPFENLDAQGTEAVIQLLNSVAQECDTVFCVTHNGDLKNKFTKTLTVVKEDKFSKLIEV